MISRIGRYGWWIVLLACAGMSACARVETRPPAALPPAAAGALLGALVADNTLGVSLAMTEIRTEGHAVTAGPDGTFSFPSAPQGKNFLVAEKRFAEGPVRRVLGVATVHLADSPVQVRIRMRDATDVDAFCLDCHPAREKVTRRDQIFRDIHPSGVVPRKANKPTGRFDERGRVTCESCHSVHRETGFPHFTLASFRDGKLCLQCH